MRILKLNLLAFGPFTGQELDFERGKASFHIVYGPNEAGKSSSLRALRHLLYGIPNTCPDNFVHAYPNLRIGGKIRNSAGELLEFICRKGRGQTLRDANDDRVIEASRLVEMLRGVDDTAFAQRFGIGHEELRKGGQAIVDGGGELGAILFAAGAGMPGIRKVQTGIETELQGLFKDRASKGTSINKALSDLNAAEKRLKETLTPTSKWITVDKALRAAKARQAELDRNVAARRARKGRLERLIDAQPALAKRKLWLERQATVADAPTLPDGFKEDREKTQTQLANDRQAREEAELELAQLREAMEREQLPIDLLARQTTIEALHLRMGGYQVAQEHLPKRAAEKERLDRELREGLVELGREPDLAILEQLRITRLERQRIMQLIAGYKASFDKHTAAVAATKKRVSEIKATEAALAGLASPLPIDELSAAVRKARKQGPLDGQLSDARAKYERDAADARIELSRLRLFQGTLAELEQLAVCDAETIDRFDTDLGEAQHQVRDVAERVEQRQREIQDLDTQLESLRLAHDVPTEADLIEARRQRAAGWQLVRRFVTDASVATDPEVLAFVEGFASGTDLLYAYQVSVERADEVADRLRREAEQVATKAELTVRRGKLVEQLGKEREQLATATDRVNSLQQDWQSHWSPLAATPLPPQEMRAWLARRNTLVDKARSIRTQATEIARFEQQLAALRDELRGHLARLGQAATATDDSLEAAIEAAEAVVQASQTAHEKRKKDTQRLVDLQQSLPELRHEQELAELEQKQLQADWADAVAVIGLPETATPADANTVLAAMDELLAKSRESADLASRIAGMNADAAALHADVQALVAEVATDLREYPVDQAIAELVARLGNATRAQTRRDEWQERVRSEEAKRDKAIAAIERGRLKLEALCKLAQCTDVESLPEIERRSAERRECSQNLRSIEDHLASLASGHPLEAFIEEATSRAHEDLNVELEQVTREVEQLDQCRAEVSQEVGSHQAELNRMDGNDQAAVVQEEAQCLLAEIRRDAEQYIRLRLAATVLKRAIERYSERGQGPVISRAGDIFAEITLGAFSGLTADYDEHDRPVLVGIRAANGLRVPVEGMSDGTCDQLYLALRLALLETYLEAHEPMPFIMDDTLIQFDDRRAVATLQVLAKLSEKTQVIYFTHHQHLVELAREHLGTSAHHMTISNPLTVSANGD